MRRACQVGQVKNADITGSQDVLYARGNSGAHGGNARDSQHGGTAAQTSNGNGDGGSGIVVIVAYQIADNKHNPSNPTSTGRGSMPVKQATKAGIS